MKQQKSYHQKGKGNRILRRALSLILCAVMIAGTAPESLAGILAVKDNVATAKAAAGTPAGTVYVGGKELTQNGDAAFFEEGNDAILWKTADRTILELNYGEYVWEDLNFSGYEFETGKAAGIYADGDLTILLRNTDGKGKYSFFCTGSVVEDAGNTLKENYGIYVDGNLQVVSASGEETSLTVSVGHAEDAESGSVTGTAAFVSAGIRAQSLTLPETAQHVDITAVVKQVNSGVSGESMTLSCDMDSRGVTLTANGGAVNYGAEHTVGVVGSFGIYLSQGYEQGVGNITAQAGKMTTSTTTATSMSAGLFAESMIQRDGSLCAQGGYAESTAGSGYLWSYGIHVGDITVTGGEVTASGAGTSGWTTYSRGIGQKSTGTEAVFSDCMVRATAASSVYVDGLDFYSDLTLKSGAVLDLSCENIPAANTVALSTQKNLYMEGGEIHASASGGQNLNRGINAHEFIIKKGSHAIVEAESGPTGEVVSTVNVWSAAISVHTLLVEEESGAVITAAATSGAYGDAHAYGIELRNGGEIKSGTITATATAANLEWGSIWGINANKQLDISGGKINATAKGINFKSSGIRVAGGAGINITGGEVTAVADLNGQTAKKKTDYPDQCLATGLFIESGEIGSISGGTVTARGSDLAVYNYGGAPLFNGAVLYASGNFDGSGAALLPESVYDIHRSNNELSDYKYLRSVAGTEIAPAVPDVDLAQRYSKTDLEVDLSDTLPEDAGIVRYVTNVKKFSSGVLLPAVKDKNGVDSSNTTISDIRIDQETGKLTATIAAVLDSKDDVITIPVSVRSEKYASVMRTVTVTISDKDVAALDGVTQESTTYGQTLSAPAYTAPVTGGTQALSYSGKLADGTMYAATDTAPDQAGHYTVKVTYETDETRYIGKADFAIWPADMSEAVVTLGAQTGADGNPHDVVIDSVTVGSKTLVKGTDYEITAGGSATEIANTVATITGIGNNCIGSKTFTWSLVKQTPVSGDFNLPTLSASGYDYTGEAVAVATPVANVNGMGAVTVYYEGSGSTDYVKTTEAPVNVGTYEVTFDVAEGTKYQAAEGLSIGTLKINQANYAGEGSIDKYVKGGEGTEGVTVTLPKLPEGTYGTPDASGTPWIDAESMQVDGRTLTFNTTDATPANGNATISIPVDGAQNYNTIIIYANIYATDLPETGVVITGSGVADGKLSKTYGDGEFTLEAVADIPGNNGTCNWKSTNTFVADVDYAGNVIVRGVGEAKIKVNYASDDSVGTGELLITVSKRDVTITGLDTVDRAYDGTTKAAVAGTPVINGLTENDKNYNDVILDTSLATAQFADKNAGNDKTVTFNGITLAGASARNYEITGINTAQADILPVSVTANVSAVSRAYVKDDLNVTLVPGAVAGVIGDDKVSVDVTNAAATMTDDAVGTDKAVTVSGVALTGEDAGNYTLSAQPAGVTVTIQKAVWTKTTAQAEAQNGEAAEFDLTDYIAQGGSLGSVTVTEGADALEGTPALSGNKLTYRFKEDARENAHAEVTIPVEGATSYGDYTLTVSLKTLHDHVIEAVEAKAPTCTDNGNIAHYKCSVCGRLFSDQQGANEVSLTSVLLPALGHDWDTVTYVWAEDNSTVTATRICKRDGTHKETEVVAATHKDVAATCETKGSITYEAEFTKTAFEKQTKKVELLALGHDWGDWEVVTPATETKPGIEKRTCKRNANHTETRQIPSLSANGLVAFFDDDALKGEVVTYNDSADAKRYEHVYTGAKITPVIVVQNNGTTLTEGTDYTVKYANNLNVSTISAEAKKNKPATVTITGKGSFTGKRVLEFYIMPKALDDGTYQNPAEGVTVSEVIVAESAKAAPVVSYNGTVLKAKDYTVTSATNTDLKFTATDVKPTLTIAGKGNFTGRIENIPVTVKTKAQMKQTAVKAALAKGVSRTYTGLPQTLTVTTSDTNGVTTQGELTVTALTAEGNTVILKEGTDFELNYSANVNAGTVKVTVSGKGAYTGSVTKSFKILPAKEPAELKAELVRESEEAQAGHYTFAKTGVTPKVTVTAKLHDAAANVDVTKTLTEGVDYKITYRNNKKVSTDKAKGSYKLTFLGNYKGAKLPAGADTGFTVDPADLSDAEVIVSDMIFNPRNKKAGKYLQTPAVTLNGILLAKNEYTVDYYAEDSKDPGTFKTEALGASEAFELSESDPVRNIAVVLTVNPKNANYKMSKPAMPATPSAVYAVRYDKNAGTPSAKTDISKAKIALETKAGGKVSKVFYIGKPITFNPADESESVQNQAVLTVTIGNPKKGGVILKGAEVYKYFNVTYANNTAKGKATVILSAKQDDPGNSFINPYAGMRSGNFTIAASNVNTAMRIKNLVTGAIQSLMGKQGEGTGID